jgi:tetratricopeptide (TPR) repeat protein
MTTEDPGVLEQDVSTLLEAGGARPQISGTARAPIRAEPIARPAVARRARRSAGAIAWGLAAAAAAALLACRWARELPAPGVTVRELDGVEVITAAGARLTELGPRHLRVDGAALIDVEPGKGAFVVDTANGRIEAQGTRFVVDTQHGRMMAAVVRGEAKLATDRGELALHAGEQGVADVRRAPVRGPAPRLSSLVGWAREVRRRKERSVEPLRHGRLFAREPGVAASSPGPEYALPISRLTVDVVVEDQVARVAFDQTFHNAAPLTLEGVYRFAIPPDAALQRLAMYVDGKRMESAVVERTRGREIYEEQVVRRVDPALLEWAGTGRLSLRVYPIRPLEDKRLLVAYTQSLPRLYDDWTLAVPLPEVDLPVGAFDVAVRIKRCASCELVSTSHRIEVARSGDDAIVTYHHAGGQIGDPFVVHVRNPRRRATIAHSDSGGERYLMVRAASAIAAVAPAYRPRTWVILDDVSASRGGLELRAQADVIEAIVRELDEQDRVAVIAFDVEARKKLALTRARDVDRRALRAALASERGVGATDLGAALDAALAELAGIDRDAAMIVYLGDGVLTTGARFEGLRDKLAGKAQFIGVGIGEGPDTRTLQGLASATGGHVSTIALADDLRWRAFDLIAALRTSRVTGLAAGLIDASGQPVLATTYLASPQLADGEEIELVSRLAGRGTPAAVELTGTLNGKPWRQTVALEATSSADAGYLPRLWAQRHIAARLLAAHEPVSVPPCAAPAANAARAACPSEAELRKRRDEAIRRDVIALGKQYFLSSRHTSLLVLETDEMYRRYGIAPGTGDTWAPYPMPATIPFVAATPPTQARPADEPELIRSPVYALYSLGHDELPGEDVSGAMGRVRLGYRVALGFADRDSRGVRLTGRTSGADAFATVEDPGDQSAAPPEPRRRLAQNLPPSHAPPTSDGFAPPDPDAGRVGPPDEGYCGWVNDTWRWNPLELPPFTVPIPDLEVDPRALDDVTRPWMAPDRRQWMIDQDPLWGQPTASHYRDPLGVAFDDVTAFVPALFPDLADRWRRQLAADDGQHAIEDAARAVLAEARRRLPTGVYRWGDLEVAVDDTRRIAWRRTTPAGLVETASLDGTTWTRRYAELGLDVTRAVGDDDLAIGLAYLPVWIAEPAHYARWFDVARRGDREVVLSRPVGGKARTMLVLAFDERARLVSITDRAGRRLVEVGWDVGPASARVLGDPLSVGFTGQAIPDAAQWAHRGAGSGVVVELPARRSEYWQRRLAAETPGSPAWRHAERQLMVAHAARCELGALWQPFEELRAHGGIELGDLVLASGSARLAATDEALAAVRSALGDPPLARYLVAGRVYARSQRPERLTPASRDGLIGALWSLRATEAHLVKRDYRAAHHELAAIRAEAPLLRMLAASAFAVASRYGARDDEVVRAWDAVATGAYRNVVRAAAAHALFRRGKYDAGAERVVQLVADLDLAAWPVALDDLQGPFRRSRRGDAGWQQLWTAWRDRVLPGQSYDHVMALLRAPTPTGGDLGPILARAAELAGTDFDRRLAVARIGIERGQSPWAEAQIRALLQGQPDHDLHHAMAKRELRQWRLAEALADLEAAQDVAADDPIDMATMRSELGQLISVAGWLAARSTGAARTDAVQHALQWGDRWRAIDPGATEVDQLLGEVMLGIGDTAAAWRQLSSAIERDPWSGAGHVAAADAFQRGGKVNEALALWRQASAIDPDNPTPRLHEARALITLGRNAEADAILAEIASRTWRPVWDSAVYEARVLLESRKRIP